MIWRKVDEVEGEKELGTKREREREEEKFVGRGKKKFRKVMRGVEHTVVTNFLEREGEREGWSDFQRNRERERERRKGERAEEKRGMRIQQVGIQKG